MTYLATSYQGAIKILWPQFWGALISSMSLQSMVGLDQNQFCTFNDETVLMLMMCEPDHLRIFQNDKSGVGG